jgi:gas vesicle protein
MRDLFEHDEETTMGSGRSFAMGLLCGAAVGAALGLLYAPQTGAATRRDLRKSAERLSRRAMKLYDNASETVEQLADRGADVLDRTKDVASRLRT